MSIDLDLFFDVEDSESERASPKVLPNSAKDKNDQRSQTFSSANTNSLKDSEKRTLNLSADNNLHDKVIGPLDQPRHHKSLAEIDLEEKFLLQIKKQKEQERLEEDAELDRRLQLVQKMKNEEILKSSTVNRMSTLGIPTALNSSLTSVNVTSSIEGNKSTCGEEHRRTTLMPDFKLNSTHEYLESIDDNISSSFISPKDATFYSKLDKSPPLNNALHDALDLRNKEIAVHHNTTVHSSDKSSIFRNAAKLLKEQSFRFANLVGKAAQKVVKSDDSILSDDESIDSSSIKYKAKKRQGAVFENTRLVQLVAGQHEGSVWALEFSRCGMFMASGGQDGAIHVWVVSEMAEEMRANKNDCRNLAPEEFRSRISMSRTSLMTDTSSAYSFNLSEYSMTGSERSMLSVSTTNTTETSVLLDPEPFVSYRSHESDVLCLSWSRSHFLVSSSMDMTVRLFNIFHDNCLCCFRHGDCVPSVAFHPQDERYFVSGSLDGIVRIWNIPDKKVAVWNKLDGSSARLITAVNFCRNGRIVAVGTYSGTCLFYHASVVWFVDFSNFDTTPKYKSRDPARMAPPRSPE